MADSRSRRLTDAREHPFAVLRENRLAYIALARLVDSRREDDEHPIVTVYGPSGCGKSHLVRQFIRQGARQSPPLSAVCLTASEFAEERDHSLPASVPPRTRRPATGHAARSSAGRSNSSNGAAGDLPGSDPLFDRFLLADFVVCEDLQALARRKDVQATLVNLIDELHAHGKRIVLTCTAAPGEAGLTARLANRCHGGVCVALESYGRNSRRKLIECFAAASQIAFPDNVLRRLAADDRSPRELLSLVRQIGDRSRKKRQAVDLDLVNAVIPHEPTLPPLTVPQVAHAVAEEFDVPLREMRTASRLRTIGEARGVAMYLARSFTGATYEEIGRYFGRNHSTVIHACRRIESLADGETALIRRLTRACTRLQRKTPCREQGEAVE